MKLPEIPTDNLYKFMAISGVVIVIASFVPFFYQHKLRIQEIQMVGERHILLTEFENLLADIKTFKKDMGPIQQLIKKQNLKDSTPEELLQEYENILTPPTEVIKEGEEIVEQFHKLYPLGIQFLTKCLELGYLRSIIRRNFILLNFGFLSGIILAVTGFLLWYKKLQLPLDMIIKNKLKEEQNNE